MNADRPQNSSAGLERRLAELSTLYEVARGLVGVRDRAQIGFRVVLTAMGAIGARSGAAFVIDERGRYRLLYSSLAGLAAGESVVVPESTREWMMREGAFTMGAAAARALGPLRDRLVETYDAAIAAAIVDRQGLLGFVAFGAPLLSPEHELASLSLLDSIAALSAQALDACIGREARAGRPQRPSLKAARSMEALRTAYPPLRSMVGSSAALLEASQDLVAVASTPFPVLLQGPSGSGKELAARAIHELSSRAEAPFEVVDCGSIPPELIESELFGHVRGAFTGAHRDRRGAFELAHRGTLFLDEIGDMPLQLQTRLLRVLQEGRIRRVGDELPLDVDVRVVAATNRDLAAEVAAHHFREDLYYRLNVFSVRVPPLRERSGDLPVLLKAFLEEQRRPLGVREWRVDDDVLPALEAHTWPGNVRELANLCAALAVKAREDGTITLADLEHVWRKLHGNGEPPWRIAGSGPRGRVGEWVLEQARASRFNLVEAARLLRRRSRTGHKPPVTERSALGYYLTGEILRALVETRGDPSTAARLIAGDEDLEPRVRGRVEKVIEAIRDGGASFAKLPGDYAITLERATDLVKRA